MKLKLIKMSSPYKSLLFDMMDEWCASGETVIPWAIVRSDYRDFENYMKNLDISEPKTNY